MRITLAELELHRINVSENYAPGSLDFDSVGFKQTAPVQLNATAELLATEIRVKGHLETRMESSCDRCLVPVEIPVSSNFDLFYRPMQTIAKEEEIEIAPAELEIGFYSGDGIEMADVATEQVILSLPMKVVCSSECRGLCPVCAGNLNLTRCKCTSPQQRGSPFASLKED